MAVVRARSAPPYGLFAAVTFAILATAGAVIFYVMWAKAADESATFQTRLTDTTGKYDLLNSGVAKLNGDLAEARLALENMTRDRDGKQATADSLKKMLDAANGNAEAAQAEMTKQRAEFAAAVAKLEDSQRTLDQAIAKAMGDKNEVLKQGLQALSDAKNGDEQERLTLVLQLQDADSKIAKLNSDIRELRQRVFNEGAKAEVSVGEPDGKVIRVNGATGEVFISLGKKDHIRPGLPFTAYDPRLGVRYRTDDEAAGNGSLEVIEVGDTMSICRITRTSPNRSIQAGDLISNIVYHNDLRRHIHFTIFGDFDLDGDGVATAAERDRLITLIKDWGGDVDDDVTAQTDYLVLGTVPKSPMLDDSADATTAPADAAASAPAPVAGSVADTRSKDQQRYDELKGEATSLAIPVLNQNRFLYMVGYYNTTVVRY